MDSFLFYEIIAWLALASVGSAVAAWLWLGPRTRRDRLLPAQHHRAVTWGLPDLLIVLVLVQMLCPSLVWQLLAWACGTQELSKRAQSLVGPPLAALLQVPAAVLALRLSSGARPYQLGLTTSWARRNVVIGFLTWLLITPVVYGVNYLASVVYLWRVHAPPPDHPLTQVIKTGPLGPTDWILFFVAAVVAAPVVEELLFRGIFQPWAKEVSWGGDVAMAAALGAAYVLGRKEHGIWPVAFVGAMVPGYLLAGWGLRRWLPRPNVARAVYGTALLFAAAHSRVWPTPVPLFVLGLALGWLAYRTQSLVGPVLAHALFNGLTCLALAFAYEGGSPNSENGKSVTIAPRTRSPSFTVSRVPDSWLPRRTDARAITTPSVGENTDDVMRPTSLLSR